MVPLQGSVAATSQPAVVWVRQLRKDWLFLFWGSYGRLFLMVCRKEVQQPSLFGDCLTFEMRLICEDGFGGFQFAGNAFQVKDKDNEIRKYKQLHDMLDGSKTLLTRRFSHICFEALAVRCVATMVARSC